MSADSKGAIATRVQELIKAAKLFKTYLDLSNLSPEYRQHGGMEIDGGRFARNLAAALEALRDSKLPVQVRVGFKALDRLFQVWIERWGWERLIGPDGEAFLSEKQQLWAKNEVSWYAAVLSHIEAYSAEEISERPHFGHFDLAREAERRGIEPASPRVTDASILDAMHNGWVHKSYLAPDFPKLQQGEYLTFRDALHDLQDGVRDNSADAPADQQPTAPPQEPFVARAPNGVLLGYGEFNAASKINVDALAVDPIAEARKADPLPDPKTLTVGEMIRLVVGRDQAYPLIGSSKIIYDHWERRNAVLFASLGFRRVEKWVQRKYGEPLTIRTSLAFRGELCKSLGQDFDEADPMELLDALRRLEPPEAAPVPNPTPESPAQPASGTKTPEAPAELPDLVTLDQAAAIVNKSKRALEYHKTKGSLPEPYTEGGGGKAALYDWRVLGPWLTREFGHPLPDIFPRARET